MGGFEAGLFIVGFFSLFFPDRGVDFWLFPQGGFATGGWLIKA